MRKKPTPTRKRVKEATAVRAIFVAGEDEMPKVQFTFYNTDGTVNEYMMNIRQAGQFIEQAMAAYNTLVPPLKTSRGGFGL